jgi:hypothetical protein
MHSAFPYAVLASLLASGASAGKEEVPEPFVQIITKIALSGLPIKHLHVSSLMALICHGDIPDTCLLHPGQASS